MLRILSSIEGDISLRRDRLDIVGLIENLDQLLAGHTSVTDAVQSASIVGKGNILRTEQWRLFLETQ